MTRISEVVTIPLPKSDVERHLLDYFETRRNVEGEAILPLRVTLRDFGLPVNFGLVRDVAVEVRKVRDADNLNDELAVRWKATDGGPYPKFTGRIVVWSEVSPKESFVELRGTYEPPLGDGGKLFDDALGHLIAQQTARGLLLELAAYCSARRVRTRSKRADASAATG